MNKQIAKELGYKEVTCGEYTYFIKPVEGKGEIMLIFNKGEYASNRVTTFWGNMKISTEMMSMTWNDIKRIKQ